MPLAPAVDGVNLDHALACLNAVGAGIHAQRAADRPGNAVVEMKPANAGVQSDRSDPLVGGGSARTNALLRYLRYIAEALGGQPNYETWYSAVTDQQVGADPDHGHRHLGRDRLEERRQIVFVGGLEQYLGRTAGAEPGDLVHAGIRRETAANAGKRFGKPLKQRLAVYHAAAPSVDSSAGKRRPTA
jgi:hypothetical protein